MKIRVVLVLVVLLILQSCKKDKAGDLVFFGGEIINPVQEQITLYKGNELIDTIPLTENTFSYSFLASEEGLYTFWHGNESQTVYIEPGDSILFRLNTLAFDKTLVYSGKEAAKNNFLMELYLMNEKNNDLVFSYYKISPKEFAKKTDSIREKRQKMLRNLREENDFSDEFYALAQKSIDYEFYDLRERYAFLINKYFSQSGEIPESFFAYRRKVDFNNEKLQNHYVYQRFLDNYLKNRSIENCLPREKDRDCYNLTDFYNLRRRILLADSLFTSEVLRKRFFQRFGSRQIIFSQDQNQIDSTFQLLDKIGYRDLDELKKLAEIQHSYFVGNNISGNKILDTDLDKLVFENVLKVPSIIFVWSVYSPEDYEFDHERIGELRQKYPEIDFIGINIDQSEQEAWLEIIEKSEYEREFEYQIRDRGQTKVLYRNYLNKIFFVDEEGKIVLGDISLDSPFLEGYILEFLNQ